MIELSSGVVLLVCGTLTGEKRYESKDSDRRRQEHREGAKTIQKLKKLLNPARDASALSKAHSLSLAPTPSRRTGHAHFLHGLCSIGILLMHKDFRGHHHTPFACSVAAYSFIPTRLLPTCTSVGCDGGKKSFCISHVLWHP